MLTVDHIVDMQKKEDSDSTKESTNALEISPMIDAAENWGEGMFDVPEAYIWANIPKDKRFW